MARVNQIAIGVTIVLLNEPVTTEEVDLDVDTAASIFAQAFGGEVIKDTAVTDSVQNRLQPHFPSKYLTEPSHLAQDCFHYADPVTDWE